MIEFFTRHSLWLAGFVLVGMTTFIAMLGPAFVRRFVTLDKLTTNNEVAGFKFATVGVLYAVLLAFAIILVWEKYSDADSAVAKEAGAVESLYHLSYGIGGGEGGKLRASLSAYLQSIISMEWPAMERDTRSAPTQQALNAVYSALLAADSAARTDNALMSELFYELDIATQARRARLVAAEGAVPGVLWFVLFGGAVVTIAFTLFFGTRNLRAQTLMTGLLSLLIFSELLIIVAIDRPFTGTVKVGPEALVRVLADFRPQPSAT